MVASALELTSGNAELEAEYQQFTVAGIDAISRIIANVVRHQQGPVRAQRSDCRKLAENMWVLWNAWPRHAELARPVALAIEAAVHRGHGLRWRGLLEQLCEGAREAFAAVGLLGVEVARLLAGGGAQQLLPLSGPLTLAHREGVLNIELSLTDFDPGPAPLFEIRLRGLEDSWSRPRSQSNFAYANLPVGSFAIEARATRGPGRSFRLTPLRFEVRPLWFQQGWVRGVFLALLLLAFGGLLQWRHRRHLYVLAARNRILDAQVAARTRELATANRRLRDLAEHDGLTGVANRRQFDRCLHELLNNREASFPLALLLLDVDFFKQFNDQHGHLAGDESLRRLATTLVLNTRPGDLVARYGDFVLYVYESLVDPQPHLALTLGGRFVAAVGGIVGIVTTRISAMARACSRAFSGVEVSA